MHSLTHRHRHSHHWAVILAGGEGERLRPLTRLVSGDDRPKQFCALLAGGRTLLQETRTRIAKAVDPERTVFVFNKQHEQFYAKEYAAVSEERMAVQPENRGTLAGILFGLMKIARRDPDAVVGFFPSDHAYTREHKFVAGVKAAYDAADSGLDRVILLGAQARYPEAGYGYIEPAEDVGGGLAAVRQFWEKPSERIAQGLIDRGCLWNTFVMVGRVRVFLHMIREAVPRVYRAFEVLLGDQEVDLAALYGAIPSLDFSKSVLADAAGSLAVLNLGRAGWSDLGEPHRLVALFSHRELMEEMGLGGAPEGPAAALWQQGLKPRVRAHACST